MKLFVGLMSGTSMDGIDAALVDVTNHQLILGIVCPYAADTALRVKALMNGEKTTPGAMKQLHTILGREFANAVHQLLAKANISLNEVIAIGSHGQTICHDAFADIPYTLQLGCAHTIAVETGRPVVADFRTRDLVLGGQGAPLAPIYHQALFAHLDESIAVVNIGGISNVTYLSQDGSISGYDIGPGNCLMDAWAQKHIAKSYDANGAWGLTGKVNEALLKSLLADSFFKRQSPKSIGKEYFSEAWLESKIAISLPPQDVQATLIALTAKAIADDIHAHQCSVTRVLICGGGAHNHALMDALKRALPNLSVDSTKSVGVDPDYIEAMMFAWLAEQRLNQKTIDLTAVTGAKMPSILGAIY